MACPIDVSHPPSLWLIEYALERRIAGQGLEQGRRNEFLGRVGKANPDFATVPHEFARKICRSIGSDRSAHPKYDLQKVTRF